MVPMWRRSGSYAARRPLPAPAERAYYSVSREGREAGRGVGATQTAPVAYRHCLRAAEVTDLKSSEMGRCASSPIRNAIFELKGRIAAERRLSQAGCAQRKRRCCRRDQVRELKHARRDRTSREDHSRSTLLVGNLPRRRSPVGGALTIRLLDRKGSSSRWGSRSAPADQPGT